MTKLLMITLVLAAMSVFSFSAHSMDLSGVSHAEALDIVGEHVSRIYEHIDVLRTVALEQGDVDTLKDLNTFADIAASILEMKNANEAQEAAKRLSLQVYGLEEHLNNFK